MFELRCGDALELLASLDTASVQSCVTSPPYFNLRNYGVEGQIGLEETPDAYVQKLVSLFREVRRVLKPDGTLWLNLGDSYGSGNSGLSQRDSSGGVWSDTYNQKHSTTRDGKPPIPGMNKQLLMIPARAALALQSDGWVLRSDIIWHKPSPMPESVRDRPTSAHEHVFLFGNTASYYYDSEAIAEPISESTRNDPRYGTHRPRDLELAASRFGEGTNAPRKMGGSYFARRETRNARNVWTIGPKPYKGAHFAVMPEELARRCVLAGSRPGDTILDPFTGSGTTGLVALKHDRHFIGLELNPAYVQLARSRLEMVDAPLLAAD